MQKDPLKQKEEFIKMLPTIDDITHHIVHVPLNAPSKKDTEVTQLEI